MCQCRQDFLSILFLYERHILAELFQDERVHRLVFQHCRIVYTQQPDVFEPHVVLTVIC